MERSELVRQTDTRKRREGMREHEINKLNNFIGGWYLDDTSICDELIEFHKTSGFRTPGIVFSKDGESKVDTDYKDSTDVILSRAPQELRNKYALENLQLVADAYVEKYTYAAAGGPWRIVTSPTIQHYTPPSGGFKQWHSERMSCSAPSVSRHLVFMTYLNDVDDGGETEFFYQKIKVKPEKGLTLIWGSDWTFTHRGIPSPTQEKYIVTGWYNYVEVW